MQLINVNKSILNMTNDALLLLTNRLDSSPEREFGIVFPEGMLVLQRDENDLLTYVRNTLNVDQNTVARVQRLFNNGLPTPAEQRSGHLNAMVVQQPTVCSRVLELAVWAFQSLGRLFNS